MLRQLPTANNEDWAILLSAFRHNNLLLIREKTNNCDMDAGVPTPELIVAFTIGDKRWAN